MLSDIIIRGLHGLYNYNIHFQNEQRVFIITGPNGYGKTTILKIIDHVLQCKFWYFSFLKFDEIKLGFQNGRSLIIRRETNEENVSEEISEAINTQEKIIIELYVADKDAPIESLVLGTTYGARLMRKYGSRYTSSGSIFYDAVLEETLEREYKIEDDSYLMENGKNIQLFLQELNCLYIQQQRLLTNIFPADPQNIYERRWGRMNVPEINLIAQNLKELFAEKQRDFASKSQEIDATFIKRLMDTEKKAYCKEEFDAKLNKLKEKIENFKKYGLTPSIVIPNGYPEELQKVLSLYIDDMEAKMAVFDVFYNQLAVFDSMISNKALSNKKILLNDNNGIVVVNDNDDRIPLNKLSSGEQNLIILYYKLVFSIRKNDLLLIDEPENSLHAAWLTKMLDDYLDMADRLQCQIIIATHSITFINGEWGMTYDLYENNN